MRALRWLLLVALLGLTGCVSIATHYIEHPGHSRPSTQFVSILEDYPPNYRQLDFRTGDGLRIAYWYGAPQALDITDKLVLTPGRLSVNFNWKPPAHKQTLLPAHGSVVLLHSWGLNATQMVYWALHFTNAGYVVLMPTLRDQGDSGDALVGYGPREAGDIEQLIRHLQDKHELPPPLYLFGYSYGATVALFAAPHLQHLRGVIAMAPYVHPADVIMRAPRTNLFTPGWWPHFLPPHMLQGIFSPRVMRDAVARADRQLGIDLATINPGNALAASHACTLLLRGSDDILISARAVRDLAARSPLADYVEIPHENHMTLFFRSGLLFDPILKWMQNVSPKASASCPDLEYKATASTLGKVRPTHRSSSRDHTALSGTR